MKRSFLLITACLLFKGYAWAGGHIVLPKNTVELALEHSRQLKIAGHDVSAMEARRTQASAARLPSLELKAGAGQYSGLEDTLLGPGIEILGIEKRYFWSAEVSQLLYNGGGARANVRAAELAAGAAASSRAALESDLRMRAIAAHWTWAKMFWAVGAAESAEARMQAHLTDVRNLKKAGAATDNDIAAADAGLAKATLRLGDTRRDLNLARARLSYLTGTELPADAVPGEPDLKGITGLPVKDLLSEAAKNRQELVSARLAVESSESLVKAARSSLRPQLALVARYEQANPNNLFFPPAEEWNDDVFIGLNLRWNIFEGGLNRAQAEEAMARADAAREVSAERNEAIALEVKEAFIRLEAALERCSTARKVEQSAMSDLLATVSMWKNGTARQSELLDADSRYSDAQFETAASNADAAIAKGALEHALGISAD